MLASEVGSSVRTGSGGRSMLAPSTRNARQFSAGKLLCCMIDKQRITVLLIEIPDQQGVAHEGYKDAP